MKFSIRIRYVLDHCLLISNSCGRQKAKGPKGGRLGGQNSCEGGGLAFTRGGAGALGGASQVAPALGSALHFYLCIYVLYLCILYFCIFILEFYFVFFVLYFVFFIAPMYFYFYFCYYCY